MNKGTEKENEKELYLQKTETSPCHCDKLEILNITMFTLKAKGQIERSYFQDGQGIKELWLFGN